MDLIIKDLRRDIIFKEAKISTQQFEMENHPIRGENAALKRKLDNQQDEIHLLQLNVNLYRAKANQISIAKNLVSIETQTDTKAFGPLAHHILNLPQKYANAKREIEKLNIKLNQLSDAELPRECPTGSGSSSDNHLTSASALPIKNELFKEQNQLKVLKKENKQIKDKCVIYKQLAVSRREKLKELEVELKRYTVPEDQ